MKLSEYMKKRSLSATALAEQLGVAVSTVTRAANGDVMPSKSLMATIHRVTAGKVTPSDFYDLETK